MTANIFKALIPWYIFDLKYFFCIISVYCNFVNYCNNCNSFLILLYQMTIKMMLTQGKRTLKELEGTLDLAR